MPRKQDPIWLKFTRSAQGKGYKATCKACQYVMQGHVERMKAHMATQGSGFPVARGQPKGRRASQSHIMAGPVGQP